jgi:hypothetical protein
MNGFRPVDEVEQILAEQRRTNWEQLAAGSVREGRLCLDHAISHLTVQAYTNGNHMDDPTDEAIDTLTECLITLNMEAKQIRTVPDYGREQHTTKNVCRFERTLNWLHGVFHKTELDGLTNAEAESATRLSNFLIEAVAKSLHEQPGDSMNGKVLIAGLAGFLRIFKSKLETSNPRKTSAKVN